jgi:hypothetical protein
MYIGDLSQLIHRIKLVRKILKGERVGGGGGWEKDEGRWNIQGGMGRGRVCEGRKRRKKGKGERGARRRGMRRELVSKEGRDILHNAGK